MKKVIGVISKRGNMARFYREQLLEMFDDIADIRVYSLDDKSLRNMVECDLYLLSATNYDLLLDRWAQSFLPPESKTVKSGITFSKHAMDLLRNYPDGTKALLINQSRHMALESIAQLYHLGVSNIEFFPCYPEIDKVPDLELAFSPGELELAPAGRHNIIDLGNRRLTVSTICEVALKLGQPTLLETRKFEDYANTLAARDYSLLEISNNSLTAESKLEIILDSLDSGIVAMDAQENVTIINRCARRMFGLGDSDAGYIGEPLREVLPWLNLGTAQAPAGGSPKLVKVAGKNIGVTVTPLKIRGQYLGAFALLQRFEEGENRQNSLRNQMARKTQRARYTFDDIIGKSPAIRRTKEIAQRMAATGASIMLDGESGVGKEMFAQAIHNASARREAAFVAINCAALPEALLESELFGYVAGSFTGASREGKIGLFEHAHRGTLFLDEIETMSPSLQAKLLRVLQEKEIVRIGANEPISVDVRVISATNENLFARVQSGSFRQDLYYRLNVIPIHIPSLAERREDIFLLMDCFQREMGTHFTLTDRAKAAFLQHKWQGNVRELRNSVEYLRYMEWEIVDYESLPEQFHTVETSPAPERSAARNTRGLLPQEWTVLLVLEQEYRYGRGLGRQGIVKACIARGYAITEHEVRMVLDSLAQQGYLHIGRGRQGSTLSESGFALVQEIKEQ